MSMSLINRTLAVYPPALQAAERTIFSFSIGINSIIHCSPLGNLAFLWSDIIKIIDTLHIKNHKDSRCKELYDPEKIKGDNPSLNTMSCEQTFVWLSRFKKILSAMRKTHFHFYLHRMVKRRNIYIEYCYANNRRPLLPKAS